MPFCLENNKKKKVCTCLIKIKVFPECFLLLSGTHRYRTHGHGGLTIYSISMYNRLLCGHKQPEIVRSKRDLARKTKHRLLVISQYPFPPPSLVRETII